jgi:hypothetical protein
MSNRPSSWLAWAGFALSVAALISYPMLFVRFAITRDLPWANVLLFAIALAITVIGTRRAFAPVSTRTRKISAVIAASLSVAAAVMFTLVVFVAGRELPASKNAPQVGRKAPEFHLLDTSGNTVSLSQLLATPIDGRAPKGVLLVFYRGYW